MVSSELSSFQVSSMVRHSGSSGRSRSSPWFSDGFFYMGGALLAILLVWSLFSFYSPITTDFRRNVTGWNSTGSRSPEELKCPAGCTPTFNRSYDSPEKTFYDDSELSYTIDTPIKNWDKKRKWWLKQHPSFAAGVTDRVLLVSGSQPSACKNPIGDHLLLRFFKNKVDYCRIHGCEVFYSNTFLHPKMGSFWAKLPVIRAAMLAHPEVEWIWWVDSDAMFTDMEFKLPLHRYRNHNVVVHGWSHLIYETKSWTSLNAGVFLIRNCQWSMDLMDVWALMGPMSPDFKKWGRIQSSTFPDKLFPESDDQSALIYLLYKEKEKYGDKIYLEGEYFFEGYWIDIVNTYDNLTEKYLAMEKHSPDLRRRHAEKVSQYYSDLREEEHLKGTKGWKLYDRRPFITHFTGCQPCSGDHNKIYAGESCWNGMIRALNFADNQVMRKYGFVHPDLMTTSPMSPLAFDYPDDGPW